MSNLYKASKIGSLEIKNRFIMTPMNLAYCHKGYVSDQLIEFYRARAKGGVGLIIVGAVGVDPDRVNTASVMQIYKDSFIPGLKKLTKAIHAEGAKIFPQIWHPGAYARSKEHSGQQAVAPSEMISNFTREKSYALKIKEIEQIVGYFGAAAKRAKQSGFDGVEIVASAGYLIAQFLSPATNKRTDKYGGDLHERMTFLLEIIRAVRKEVGPDFPVMVRIAGNEYIRGGNTNEDAVKIAKALEKAGVDAINVTGGWHETAIPQLTMDVPPAAYLYLAKQVKKGINIPVVACNRIDVNTAERIIDNQEADFVGIARGFVADADLVNKALKNKYDLIRPCIGCNQGCLDNVFKGKPLCCLANPEAGRESELIIDSLMPNEIKSKNLENVLIIGAGAAGMEYARVAASKGHKVTIWEAGNEYGGQLMLAGAPLERRDFLRLRDYLHKACKELNVKFIYKKNALAKEINDAVLKGVFDRVVIATGAQPITPSIPVEEGAKVVQAWDVLREKSKIGKNVVIIGGGAVGVETGIKIIEEGTLNAETLKFLMTYKAEKPETLYKMLTTGNKKVTIVEMLGKLGKDIGPSTRWMMIGNLRRFNINQMPFTKVVEIKKDGVVVENTETKKQSFVLADTVILAIGSRSVNNLAHELKGKIAKLSIIGDANKPRKVIDAIQEAFDMAIQN